jgi:hypothetical protein
LKMLGEVLSNPGARTVLMMRNSLREAYQQVESKRARFETALVNARQEVETAMSQIIGYDPDDTTLLEIGRELRDNTDQLYDTMESITKKAPAKAKGKKSRMLAIPDASVPRTKLTDWLEIKAIASADGRVGFGTLTSATALVRDEQETNIGDENAAEEALVLCVQTEIARRLENIGDDYPFRIDDKGRALLFVTPVTEAGSVYLFCLFLSHAFDNTIVSEDMSPVVNNRIRDLFQACATIAAGGYIQGPSMSFAFPDRMAWTFSKRSQALR